MLYRCWLTSIQFLSRAVFNWVSKSNFAITLVLYCYALDPLNNSYHVLNQSEVKSKPILFWLACMHFFVLVAGCIHLPWVLISLLDCLHLLWLARVTTNLVLVLRHSIENRSWLLIILVMLITWTQLFKGWIALSPFEQREHVCVTPYSDQLGYIIC